MRIDREERDTPTYTALDKIELAVARFSGGT